MLDKLVLVKSFIQETESNLPLPNQVNPQQCQRDISATLESS